MVVRIKLKFICTAGSSVARRVNNRNKGVVLLLFITILFLATFTTFYLPEINPSNGHTLSRHTISPLYLFRIFCNIRLLLHLTLPVVRHASRPHSRKNNIGKWLEHVRVFTETRRRKVNNNFHWNDQLSTWNSSVCLSFKNTSKNFINKIFKARGKNTKSSQSFVISSSYFSSFAHERLISKLVRVKYETRSRYSKHIKKISTLISKLSFTPYPPTKCIYGSDYQSSIKSKHRR